MFDVDRSELIPADPKAKSSGSNLDIIFMHVIETTIHNIEGKIQRKRDECNRTELLVDDGHIRNSLVTVIITHTVEFFGAYIDRW